VGGGNPWRPAGSPCYARSPGPCRNAGPCRSSDDCCGPGSGARFSRETGHGHYDGRRVACGIGRRLACSPSGNGRLR
jgi:hypothetical protein